VDALGEGRTSIPALIDFVSISTSGEGVFKAVRDALPELPANHSMRKLLDEGFVTLLIDDIDYTDAPRLAQLERFVESYPRNRLVVSSSEPAGLQLGVVADLRIGTALTEAIIQPLKISGIRSFTTKYNADGGKSDNETLVRRVIEVLRRNSLPATAFTVSVILEVFDNLQGEPSVNQATLIDRFVEYLLGKARISEASRRTFDYADKIGCLASLARFMTQKEEYDLPYEEYVSVVSAYIDRLGYPHDPREVAKSFIRLRVLRQTDAGTVVFYMKAFMEYFAGKAMIADASYKEWVLDESRYLGYLREIEAYAGLVRSDKQMLDLVAERYVSMKERFHVAFGDRPQLRVLDTLRLPVDKDNDEVLSDLQEQIAAPRLTKEDREEYIEAEFADAEQRQNVVRPKAVERGSQYLLALLLYSVVLRNSEHVEREVKERHVGILFHAWAEYLFRSFNVIPSLVKHRKIKIDGVEYRLFARSRMSDQRLTRHLMLYLPTGISTFMKTFFGSEKLERQLADLGGEEVEIVRLLRLFLAIDLDFDDWPARVHETQGRIAGSRYLTGALLWKLNTVHRLFDLTEDREEPLAQTIARMYSQIASGGDPKKESMIFNQELRRLRLSRQVRLLKDRKADAEGTSVTIEPV